MPTQLVDDQQRALHSVWWRIKLTLALTVLGGAVAFALLYSAQHDGVIVAAYYLAGELASHAPSYIPLSDSAQRWVNFYNNPDVDVAGFIASALHIIKYGAGIGAAIGAGVLTSSFVRLAPGARPAKRFARGMSRAVLLAAGAYLAASDAAALGLPSPLAKLALYAACAAAMLLFIFTVRRAPPPVVDGGVRDVAEDADALRELAAAFKPEQYINLKRGVFVGLDQKRAPVYIPRSTLDKNHIEIIGESGVGKSSLAGVLLSQLAAAGEAIIILDPKADKMLPAVLAKQGERMGFPVRLLDLRPGAGAQCNPFLNCTAQQVEELLQVALDLGETGNSAVDFHRAGDREAAALLAEWTCAKGEASMRALVNVGAGTEVVTERENLWRKLRQ